MSAWAAFWLCLAVFIVCEAFLVSRGIDMVIWQFRTPAELELQKKLVNQERSNPMTDSKRAAAALPSLPEAIAYMTADGEVYFPRKRPPPLGTDFYTAEQVEQIRREAVRACAAIVDAREPWTTGDDLRALLEAMPNLADPVSSLRNAAHGEQT